MRYLFISSVVLLFAINGVAQTQSDSSSLFYENWLFQFDTSNVSTLNLDSLRTSVGSYSRYPKLSNGPSETNGFRDENGELFTMRIIVPRGNYAVIRPCSWTPPLNSLMSGPFSPSIKKE